MPITVKILFYLLRPYEPLGEDLFCSVCKPNTCQHVQVKNGWLPRCLPGFNIFL